jgi:hypothetical protein
MQLAQFGLLIAIPALKRPHLTLDLWVQRSPHEIGSSAAVWAADRFNAVAFHGGGFFLLQEPVTHLSESHPPLSDLTADI